MNCADQPSEANSENVPNVVDLRRLNWKAAVQQSPLMQTTQEAIVETVNRTRLWKREKTAVAMELLAHFMDGIEAGANEKTLLQSFGAPRKSAQLIRRSKIRCRRAFWHLALWFWRSVAALVLLYFSIAVWLAWHSTHVSTNWAALNASRPATIATPIAWPIYQEAISEMDSEVDSLDRIPGGWRPDWASFDSVREHAPSPESRRWLTSHRSAIELIVHASQIDELGIVVGPHHNYGLNSPAVDWGNVGLPCIADYQDLVSRFPHLIELQAILQVLPVDCLLQIEEGNGIAAFDDIQAILGLGRHISQIIDGTFSGQLLSLSCAAECIQYAIIEHPQLWNDAQLSALQAAISRHSIDFSRLIEDSQLHFNDAMGRAYADNGLGEGYLTMQGINLLLGQIPAFRELGLDLNSSTVVARALSPIAMFSLPKRSEVEALYARLNLECRNAIHHNLWEPVEAQDKEETNPNDLAYAIVSPFIADRFIPLSNMPLAEGKRDGLVLGIAIELFHRKHGRLPTELAELVPDFVSKLPIDLINGGPLHLSLIEHQPVVYSLGIDGDDDNGHVPTGSISTHRFLYLPRAPDPATDIDGDWVLWGKTIARD